MDALSPGALPLDVGRGSPALVARLLRPRLWKHVASPSYILVALGVDWHPTPLVYLSSVEAEPPSSSPPYNEQFWPLYQQLSFLSTNF